MFEYAAEMMRSTGGTEELLALRSWSRALADLDPSGTDADQVDLLRELERLKSATPRWAT
ncbi:hypothetical protein BH10ACT10_BH10ACT10_23740 [soil metagenome]